MTFVSLPFPDHIIKVLLLLNGGKPWHTPISGHAKMLQVQVIFGQIKVWTISFPAGVIRLEWVQPLVFVIDAIEEQEVRNGHFLKALYPFVS